MKLTALVLASVLAAPAFAQEARIPHAPPPEGFYRNISGAYDLLFRPYASSDIQLAKAPGLSGFQQRATPAAAPLPPPCEPAPTANAPAAKPAGPSPCPATR
jgi:hypothetical protein